MGLVQGEGMAARFFHRLGASRWTAPSAPAPAARRWCRPTAARSACTWSFRQSRLILIWGSNSITSNLHFWTFAQQAKRAGARLVCIDPRRTETADKCHQHIALLPGHRRRAGAGLMHELIATTGWTTTTSPRHTLGWPALRERALQWPPERAAQVCGITPQHHHRASWRATTPHAPAAIRLNYGMQRVHGGGNAVRLVALLPCLVGAWRHRAGGLLLSSSGWFRGGATTRLRCSGRTCWPAASRARSTW
jgi:anaerobic selenocysteine-containing dehydrogenase